ncbi:20175_t:CDS:2, partial [Rhizophagus irregularis]
VLRRVVDPEVGGACTSHIQPDDYNLSINPLRLEEQNYSPFGRFYWNDECGKMALLDGFLCLDSI